MYLLPNTANSVLTLLCLFFFTIFTFSADAQTDTTTWHQLMIQPKTYSIYKAERPLEIDGRATEDSWEKAAWTDSFEDIEGDIRPKPQYDTKAKMLWDDQYLYIYAKLEEPHIWGDITTHDAIIFHNNDFEVFLQNLEYADHYYEIEINILNTLFDLFMPKTYRSGGQALVNWDVKGIRTAIHHEGTANNPNDTDEYWAVEMAIPFSGVYVFGQHDPPKNDDVWRINFSRVQWKHDVIKGNYQRRRDGDTGKVLPEDNWVWSPIGIVDMHNPERWGYIKFIDTPVPDVKETTFELPEKELIKQRAWLIYYLQRRHHRLHQTYSKSLTELATLYPTLQTLAKGYMVEMESGGDWFTAKISDPKQEHTFKINQHGQLSPSKLDQHQ